eukprot:TRINITY_DN379_c3_g1_i2.p2 TRINITY_DN379_c3_g1~~TRINITY_DN379_c3_g1_i2.p2  ORF type:complete len:353 (+),score=93.69 TRINITY_DN379_c3_g1_i2:54-1112(+)
MAEKRSSETSASPTTKKQKVEWKRITSPMYECKSEPYHEYDKYYKPENFREKKGIDEDGEKGRIIDGKKIAEEIREKIKKGIESRMEDAAYVSRRPGLVVVLVGENPASKVYVRQKQRACVEVGIESTMINLPADTTLEKLLSVIDDQNNDPAVDGILVQLPLPAGPLNDNVREVIDRINPSKDVDGFHPANLGTLVSRAPAMRPCTPWGVMHLIWSTGVNPYGLECVVVGASNHVGRPMTMELALNGASVTLTHRFTRDLESHIRRAECVIVAAGKPGLVKGEWIRPGAIVIDIGINRLENGKLVGDVDFESAKVNAGWITPVPGGVGPMTVAMLLQNTLTAFDMHRERKE